MSDKVKKINRFFANANRKEVESVLSEMILSERQRTVLEMYYLQRKDVNFIADSLYVSAGVIKNELSRIRSKLLKQI